MPVHGKMKKKIRHRLEATNADVAITTSTKSSQYIRMRLLASVVYRFHSHCSKIEPLLKIHAVYYTAKPQERAVDSLEDNWKGLKGIHQKMILGGH